MELRIEIPVKVLIEMVPSYTDRIYIESTRLNDYDTSFTELTENGTKYNKIETILYGIMMNGNLSMSKKTGEFEYEPMNSSKNNKFYKEFRFNTYEDAKKTYLKFHGETNYFQDNINRQINIDKGAYKITHKI